MGNTQFVFLCFLRALRLIPKRIGAFFLGQVNNYSHWCLDQMDFVLEKRVFFCVYTNHATCNGGNQILDESSCLTNWTVDHSDCISFDYRDWRWWNSSNRAAKGIVYLNVSVPIWKWSANNGLSVAFSNQTSTVPTVNVGLGDWINSCRTLVTEHSWF